MSPARGERSSNLERSQDRFDKLGKAPRVGVHRISGRVRRGWRYLIVGLVASAVLIAAGIIGLKFIDYRGTESTAPRASEGSAEEKVVPKLDPEATIVILNGNPTLNLAAGLDEAITANQWGKILFSDNADSRDVPISAVFYSDVADLAAAEGLADKLGGVSTYESQNYVQFGARLVVLLGADYAGPGFTEAKQITAQLGGEAVAKTQ